MDAESLTQNNKDGEPGRGNPFHSALERAGHQLIRTASGEVDDWQLDYDDPARGTGHNGPRCSLCGCGWCVHCEPTPEPCPKSEGRPAGLALGPVLEPAGVWFYRLGRIRGMRVEATRLLNEAASRAVARLDELMETTTRLASSGPVRERLWYTEQELNAVSLTASVLGEELEMVRERMLLGEHHLEMALCGTAEERSAAADYLERVRVERVLMKEERAAQVAAWAAERKGGLEG